MVDDYRGMLSKRSVKCLVGIATATSLLLGLGFAASAQAAKRHFYSLNTANFVPADNSIAYTNRLGAIDTKGTAGGCFNAGLHLPQGAKMQRLTVYYRAQAPLNLLATLTMSSQFVPIGGGVVFYRQFQSDSAGQVQGSVAIPQLYYSTIDNQKYSYGLEVCLNGTGVQFFGARIEYFEAVQ